MDALSGLMSGSDVINSRLTRGLTLKGCVVKVKSRMAELIMQSAEPWSRSTLWSQKSKNDLMVFYVRASSCDKICTNSSHDRNILNSIKR